MSTMVPMYGFGGGGGKGASLTVNAPAGCTVTVSKDGKTKTKVAGTDGVAVFRGLATGQWTVNMTDGAQTAPTKTADITADYAITMSFFAATIHVTYPAGSTCTATDGVTTLTAPDTSGTWDCVVPNAGTWTFLYDGISWESVTISVNGQSVDVHIGCLFSAEKSVNKGIWAKSVSSTGSFSVGNDKIYLSNSSNNGNYPVCVVNDTPITGDGKTIIVTAEAYNVMAAASYVGLTNNKNDLDRLSYVSKTTMGTGELKIQLPSDGGVYYFKAVIFRADSPAYTATCSITEIRID